MSLFILDLLLICVFVSPSVCPTLCIWVSVYDTASVSLSVSVSVHACVSVCMVVFLRSSVQSPFFGSRSVTSTLLHLLTIALFIGSRVESRRLRPSVRLSTSLYLCQSASLSPHLCLCLSASPSIWLSVYCRHLDIRPSGNLTLPHRSIAAEARTLEKRQTTRGTRRISVPVRSSILTGVYSIGWYSMVWYSIVYNGIVWCVMTWYTRYSQCCLKYFLKVFQLPITKYI